MVTIGSGDIATRLLTRRTDKAILAYKTQGKLLVTWAEVAAYQLDAVESYLVERWNPLIEERFPGYGTDRSKFSVGITSCRLTFSAFQTWSPHPPTIGCSRKGLGYSGGMNWGVATADWSFGEVDWRINRNLGCRVPAPSEDQATLSLGSLSERKPLSRR